MHSWPNLKYLLFKFCSFLDKQLLSCQVGAEILAHKIEMTQKSLNSKILGVWQEKDSVIYKTRDIIISKVFTSYGTLSFKLSPFLHKNKYDP